jgi:hypothetical protein
MTSRIAAAAVTGGESQKRRQTIRVAARSRSAYPRAERGA